MNVAPVTLEGNYVRLEPLSLEHVPLLCDVGLDPEIWKWTTTLLRTPEDVLTYVETALQWQAEGRALPFAIVEKRSGEVVGSTRYGNIDRDNRRLEIGWTWIALRWQRTSLNTEAKYLLLRHAFEVLGCIRVEFKTDVLNAESRRALLRIGAREEGILRRHMTTAGGRIRDTVYYSILEEEWPGVKQQLERKLGYTHTSKHE